MKRPILSLLFVLSILSAANVTQFGAFNIGITHQTLHRQDVFNDDALYFALKRGVGFSQSLIYAQVDGAIGEDYKNGLYNAGIQVGLGYNIENIIPFVHIGYTLGNLPVNYTTHEQFRIYGASIEGGFFMPFDEHLGVEISYRYAQPQSNIPHKLTIHTHRFMFSVGYYDFSLY